MTVNVDPRKTIYNTSFELRPQIHFSHELRPNDIKLVQELRINYFPYNSIRV